MKREIVVFERDERHTDNEMPELDFRLMRQALPSGSCPLAFVQGDEFPVQAGQWFSENEVTTFAETQSGYRGRIE